MRRWLVLKGKSDTWKPPDWYRLGKAAKYWGVPPWVLLEQPIFWTDKAIIAINAEAEAEEALEKQHQAQKGGS